MGDALNTTNESTDNCYIESLTRYLGTTNSSCNRQKVHGYALTTQQTSCWCSFNTGTHITTPPKSHKCASSCTRSSKDSHAFYQKKGESISISLLANSDFQLMLLLVLVEKKEQTIPLVQFVLELH